MMEYLGISSMGASSSPMCRYWCTCCKVESQYVDSAPSYSILSASWKPFAVASGGGFAVTYEYDED